MKQRFGFSLLEALVTMGLVSLTFALTAGLMGMYSRASRLTGVRNTGYQALEAILYQMRSEVMGAVDFQSPASPSGNFSSVLEFRKVDRHVPSRLEDYPLGWTPYDIVGTAPNDNFLVSIRYQVQNEGLDRDVRLAGQGNFSSYKLIPRDIVSLGAKLNTDNTVDIRVEVKGSGKTRFYQNRCLRRVR